MVERRVLPNGIIVLSEKLDSVRSASVGIWIRNGSRYESAQESGVSHFIEHMLFKGTKNRNSSQIAEQMDAIGGQFNAFTTKECTSFYFRALDTMLERGIDVLTDILENSIFPEGEFETERGVINEEIDMYEDTPDELVVENLFSAVYPDSPLGRPIIGTHESLAAMDTAFLRQYQYTHYTGSNIVAAVSGNFSPDTIDYLCTALEQVHAAPAPEFQPAQYHQGEITRAKPIEQVHICLGFPALSLTDPRRYALAIFSNILGGGMSSRLFRKIREESGLCYSVYSFNASHLDTGVSGIYLATNPSTYHRAMEMALSETRRLLEEGPQAEEFERTREQIKANVLMSLESTLSRMNSIARAQLLQGRILSADEVVAAYDAVDIDACMEAGRIGFDMAQVSRSLVGNIQQ